MVKLHEYQGKAILREAGIRTPKGGLVHTPGEARALAVGVGGPVVVKAQVWVTSRAQRGLIRLADTPDAAASAAADILGQTVDGFSVQCVLVEEQIKIAREFYLGMIIDDRVRAPVLLLSESGGSGVEGRAEGIFRHVIDVERGLRDFEARDLCRRAGIGGKLLIPFSALILQFYGAARACEARTAEINPLALLPDDSLMALDARITVDDYAVFRHPELGIDVAREFDHPPTRLEQIAWDIEKHDYRGTFYFTQLETEFKPGDRVIGFHGNGGGGAMITMDALRLCGFRIANFVDTSGNPPASKVYRAARLILSQSGIDGYLMGGSGVASQEQYVSARGLLKAFLEAPLHVPAVIRIGGNGEERAIALLSGAGATVPAPIEAYGRDTSPGECVERLAALVESHARPESPPASLERPAPLEPYTFETITGGTVILDHAACRTCTSKVCIERCDPRILSLSGDVPVLNISRDEARRGGCTECLACDVECYFSGNRGGRVLLPIEGLN